MKKEYKILICTLLLIAFILSSIVMVMLWLKNHQEQNQLTVFANILIFAFIKGFLVFLLCREILHIREPLNFDDPDNGYVPLREFKEKFQNEGSIG